MLRGRIRTISACLCLLLLCNGISIAQEKKLACGDHPDLLRNEQGKIVWIRFKELNERATYRDLTPDQALHGQGTVNVIVLVNPKGEVECAKALGGSELFTKPAEQRARNWKFKPIEKDGNPVAVYGLLSLHIKYGSFSVPE
jgi:hypothetical protein